MRYFFLVALLLVLSVCSSHLNEENPVHFYCRVCGSVITNLTNVVERHAVGADSMSILGKQKGDVKIPIESFDSSVLLIAKKSNLQKVWKGKRLLYVDNIANETTIANEKQKCPHFPEYQFSFVVCDVCKSHLGYYVQKQIEEEEFGEDNSPEDFADYDEDEIADMFPIPREEMDEHLNKIFASSPIPTRTTGYWSYRYRHKDVIEQYHSKMAGVPNDLELVWSLGSYDEERSGFYALDMSVTPPKPYYYLTYSNGQMCDETQLPRQTEVRFESCDIRMVEERMMSQLQPVQFRSVEEVSICKYIVRLCLPSLEKPKSLVRKEGFFALSMDSVIPSSDEQLNDLLDRDVYQNTFHLYLCL